MTKKYYSGVLDYSFGHMKYSELVLLLLASESRVRAATQGRKL